MRTVLPVLVLSAIAAGCTTPDAFVLEHRSQLDVRSRGIVLDEDGRLGMAGMFGTTCDVTTKNGNMGADYDYASDEDEVQDGLTKPNGNMVSLVVTPNEVNITRPEHIIDMKTHAVLGVVEGRLTEDGFVTISEDGGCAVTWHDSAGRPTVEVEIDDNACVDPNATVDPDSGTFYIATDDGVIRVTPEGAEMIAGPDNALLAWDAFSDALYAASRGGSTVSAFEADGAERWETEVDGAITALSDMGAEAAAAVSVETGATMGAFVALDGMTGEVRAELETPSPAKELVSSGDGQVIGFVLKDSVHFFDLVDPATVD